MDHHHLFLGPFFSDKTNWDVYLVFTRNIPLSGRRRSSFRATRWFSSRLGTLFQQEQPGRLGNRYTKCSAEFPIVQHIPSFFCLDALHNGPPPPCHSSPHDLSIHSFSPSHRQPTTISKITFIRSSQRQRGLLRFLIIIISTLPSRVQTDLNKQQRPLITTARPS